MVRSDSFNLRSDTLRKESKYGVFSSPYFSVFSPNTGKYGPEKTPYLDTFHVVICIAKVFKYVRNIQNLILDQRSDFT